MRMLIKELTPSRGGGGGGGGTCSLVPLEKMALFPKNKILIFYVPCSPKWPVFPCSPYFYAFVPLFPNNPGRASELSESAQSLPGQRTCNL